MIRVLVVDDDSDLRYTVSEALTLAHFQVDLASDGDEAVNKVRAGRYDLVLLDVNMPKLSGLDALTEIKAHDPSIIVLILTAYSNVRDAIEATKRGAYNYLEKPIQADNLVYLIERALKAKVLVQDMSLAAPVFRLPGGGDFVGQSQEMKKIFGVIERLAQVDTAVLIRGESGTGKELVAQAIHFNGPRKDNRFVTVNCSAIPENLIESEFFGHEKGAFTGADSRKIGKFQYAEGGTLFLDEIGDVSAAMQVKLLRALQEKRFTPVGSNREIEVNVRIVAATNRDLEGMIGRGEFREDLYYRLNVLPVSLPPLRDRKNDIEHLTRYFVDKFNHQHRKRINSIAPEAMALLLRHEWPGNIRELENVIEHAFVIEASSVIGISSLPESVLREPKAGATARGLTRSADPLTATYGAQPLSVIESSVELGSKNHEPGTASSAVPRLDFQASKEDFERQFLTQALRAFRGRINQTAIHANIPKKTLLRKLEKYGINARDFAPRGQVADDSSDLAVDL